MGRARGQQGGQQGAGRMEGGVREAADGPTRGVRVLPFAQRLTPKHGEKVFDEEKDAVNKLRDLLKDKKSTIVDATLQSFITRLVNADRQLASVAIDDAIAALGRQNKIDQATSERVKGDQDVATQKFESGMEHYRNAWAHALEAV